MTPNSRISFESKRAVSFESWARVALGIIAVLVLTPSPAFAQATSAGGVFCNVFKNIGGLPFFISAIAYLAGGATIIKGIFDLIKRSTDPNVPLRNGLISLIVGAAIFSMPWLVEWLHTTIYGDVSSGYSKFACGTAPTPTTPGAPVPLDEMLANFVNNFREPLVALISLLAMVFGGIMIFYNMIKLSRFGTDGRTNSLTPILASLAIGAMLMAAGQTLSVSLTTLFGTDAVAQYSTIAYEPGGGFDLERFNRAMRAVFYFLYIVGLISFVRGFFILKNALEGNAQQTKGQAFTHMIGGTLLVNMPGFIQVIEQSTGIDIIK